MATRVLVLAPSLELLGGQSIQAALLVERLRQEAAIEVSFQPVNPRLAGFLGRLQRTKYIRTVLTSLWFCALVITKIPRHDVIHVFSASYLSFLLAPAPAILMTRLLRRKALLNYHSGEAEDHLSRSPLAVQIARLADAIVVPSAYLVDVFRRFGLPAVAVPNAIETDRFRYRERSPLRPAFLGNRNLECNYNVACVLRAFAQIQKALPNATLTLAGEGSQRAALEDLASELHLRNVRFLGKVPHAAMPALYDEADVFLNGSDVDNLPLSILEAFACGLPVITTDAGGIPYLVEHGVTGLVVPRNDSAALARSAVELLSEPDRARWLARNAFEASKTYRWDAIRVKWLDVYRRLSSRELPVPTRAS